MLKSIPMPNAEAKSRALKALLRQRHPLAALQVFHEELGDIFRIQMPGFSPVFLVGPQAARFVLVQARDELRWRNESDPVTDLLRHGVLVEDGDSHDRLRRAMNPALHRRMLADYTQIMWRRTDQIVKDWSAGGVVDMLAEMRKVALLILLDTLYKVDFTPELDRLWQPIMRSIGFISPGLWMIWRGVPRIGYQRGLRRLDDYLYSIIHARRAANHGSGPEPKDLLGLLIQAGLEDELIRDQLLTMLIAGHDTATALLAWTLYLLGRHPEAMCRAQEEVETVLHGNPPSLLLVKDLKYLDRVIKESLRLYPPIHLGSRLAAVDLAYEGYHIPAGERVIYSIYLTQRHKDYWPDPHRFDPDRHLPGRLAAPYAWLAFGGGPRNCIGAAFGQLEAKVVLARLLQLFDLTLHHRRVHPHMGATLEPRPGVRMKVYPRHNSKGLAPLAKDKSQTSR